MKHRFAVLTALLVAGAPALAQSNDFEGVITMRMRGDQGERTIMYMARKGIARMEMDAGGGRAIMLMDAAKHTATVLMPEQQVYMQLQVGGPDGPAVPAVAPRVDAVKTGKTETILGYTCEVWIFKEQSGETEACIAKGLGSFLGVGDPSGRGMGPAGGWQRELREQGGFPLRVKAAGGQGSFEVTKIEKKALDDSLFTIPAGYQKMEMPSMRRP